ncbi:response regulator, partial [bacterium]|nr:response regulator [bacterium]
GLSELCIRTSLTPKQEDYLTKINSSAIALLGIINDILDFSKIEAGKLTMEKIPFDLDKVLDSLATVIGVKTAEKGLELLFDRQRDVPSNLVGDPLRLGQILTNLANNAVKFTEEGDIVVKMDVLEKTEEEVTFQFAVTDTGIGMSQEQLGRLFKSFSQADTSTSRKYGGTGLGLVISKQLVEMMNGHIEVESEQGRGTTFKFTAILGIGQEKVNLAEQLSSDLHDLHVLVVDDNPHARDILQSYLQSFSFRCEAVSCAEKALELLKDQSSSDPFQLVMMDFKMPGMDGLTASRHIKTDLGLPLIPQIILVSAYSQSDLADAGEMEWVDNSLSKPVNHSLLFDVVMEGFGHEVTKSLKEQRETESEETELLASIRGAKILLVEDNKINQQVAVEMLEQGELVVEIANNGQEAIDMLSSKNYDCVLMDVQMPVMDGYTATLKLREQEKFRDLPILAMTANATLEDKEKAEKIGMNAHISKPIDRRELYSNLTGWIKPKNRNTFAEKNPNPVSTQGVSAELPSSLPGINLETGLQRVGNKSQFLRKLLIEFFQDHADDVVRIRGAIKEGDLDTAQRLAHTIKGIAGTIGAESMQRQAENLEEEINKGQQDGLTGLIDQLEKVMSPVMKGLSTLASKDTSGDQVINPVSVKDLIKELDQLSTLVENMDPEAEDGMRKLAKALKGKTDPVTLRKASSQISGFDFEAALVTLAELRETLSADSNS